MSDDLKDFTYNCLHCKNVFTITLTEDEFITSRLQPITVLPVCPHCDTKHRCKIIVNGDQTNIRCEFA